MSQNFSSSPQKLSAFRTNIMANFLATRRFTSVKLHRQIIQIFVNSILLMRMSRLVAGDRRYNLVSNAGRWIHDTYTRHTYISINKYLNIHVYMYLPVNIYAYVVFKHSCINTLFWCIKNIVHELVTALDEIQTELAIYTCM